ncbi:hypothetical protein KIH39_21720 [Telmatocola sphagniphila]|jgi:hypothetical protein|uniref:Uncharacterized protein n=1 Tax=Telmatocola sphagniphila TaxID=1123043 RepID=A0A8E6B4T5_9BACT|nr:hypothetical protein [Telmatocola sphagniphila]QVL31439.1 hypothetical protein KIH39_21720 [Telmatocola sphagniphila]
MSITIHLPEGTETKLRQKAELAGVSIERYLTNLAELDLSGESRTFTRKSFDEILAPARQSFVESGDSEAELTRVFEAARNEVWSEKQKTGLPTE